MQDLDGRLVANYVLDYCDERNRHVTNLSLQKLTYFCHVWYLVKTGKPLIRHSFEAWEFGPVLPYLYRAFKIFDSSPITARATRIDPTTGKAVVVVYNFDKATESLLDEIINFYSRIRSTDLVELSHIEGGPWHAAWYHGGSVNPGMKISDDRIKEFYSRSKLLSPIQ